MSHKLCPWCETQFVPRRSGGINQRFCSTICRNEYHAATRIWAQQMVEEGEIPVAVLRDALSQRTR